jgi:prepilin-type N-terminal cleavage/methylation domain-containing protein
MTSKSQLSSHGFTLMELMIVLGIMSITLAADFFSRQSALRDTGR